jgi:exopolyphosphatase/guanosine-5'-triphosphate,3'-diphosphate pyrophosphatase
MCTALKASVIDLGYNSLKMVSYEIRADNSFRAYDQQGKLTRLGEGLHQTGFLSEEPIDRTLSALELLNEINRLGGVNHVLAVATSPVRDAANGQEFLKRAQNELGVRFRVLTGLEEALFSYVGAARATRFRDVLFFDLGGGSLELTYAKDFRVKKILSLPIGALRMTELYSDVNHRFNKKDHESLRKRVEELLPSRGELGLSGETVLMGVGGTVRALAKYDQWQRDYPLNKLHNYVIRRKSILAMGKSLRKMDAQKISRIEAMGKDRAESITAGSLIVGMLMSRLRFGDLVVSTHGLRDGILSEYLRDPAFYAKGTLNERRANESLESWFATRSGTEEFTRALASRGIVSADERSILNEGIEGFLDVYMSTRAESLFYSILNEDSYLDHRDQLALALAMVRAKAPKTSNWFYARYKALLKDKSKESLEKVAAFVQFAEILELTHSKATVRKRGMRVRFNITSSKKDFPTELLDQAVQELEDATGLRVKTTVERKHVQPLPSQVSQRVSR